MFRELQNLKAISSVLLDRVELYSQLIAVETRIEKALIFRRLTWVGIGVLFAVLASVMAHVAVIAYAWNGEYRMFAIFALLVFDSVTAVMAINAARGPAPHEPFQATKRELSADMSFLKESV